MSCGPLFGSMDDDMETFPYLAQLVPTEDLIPVGVATIIKLYGWRKAVVITQDVPEFISVRHYDFVFLYSKYVLCSKY